MCLQYHALGLLYHIRKHDKLAVNKLVMKFSKHSLKSPYAYCLLVCIVLNLVLCYINLMLQSNLSWKLHLYYKEHLYLLNSNSCLQITCILRLNLYGPLGRLGIQVTLYATDNLLMCIAFAWEFFKKLFSQKLKMFNQYTFLSCCTHLISHAMPLQSALTPHMLMYLDSLIT